ncbi:uncharacterized protein LOC121262410 isoform X4 [Juglans microcarpa x Juglans regia]|uniref:uncharacterized protein LOC121262410 isoform X4 n=1 Tax=Juglans microcarpa x Juglans regia TaxID=2249226 RepID=UPI001B7E4F1A|nr:uncharacterized protein LOC121262410 isoform X4 [Juglans microcarpa x Juglans regia]
MEIVTAVAAKIAEVIVVPVGQWLCYACHYKSNMKNLKNQVKKLQNAKDKVQHTVKIASDNGDEIEVDVKTWLTEVDGIIDQFGGGEEEAESRNSNVSWLNLKQRHQISREAKEMVDNIAELLKMANFDRVSRRPAAQEMVTPRNVDYMTLDSRISITKRIMEALGDANINKIGVWGSPGVGKSTLMKEIFRKAKEESLFDEVALANVTESPNLSQIQEEIANMLDLKLDPNCKTEMVRAGHLRARLEKDKEKKILVILDDIWKRLDLEEIGIIPSDRCKVLLTSRDRHVLASEMVTEENSFKLDTLGGEEAWNLFEKMAGDFVKDDLDLRHTAIEVARACGGLPIALVTVSRALKNKNLRIWKDALVQLTRPTAEHDTDIWLPVYTCIQLSYKHLVGRELKSLFLLCAQQGYYISYRDLLRYGFGLCLFRGIDTLDEARNRLENLVSKLQDACLLLQSPHSSEKFYMHDLVRHVATIIASNDDHNMSVMRGDGGQKAWPDVDSLKRCEALSIHGGDHIHKYSNEMECPKLRYFHVQCKGQSMEIPNISFHGMDKLEDIFFQGMEKLEVLSLKNIQLSSLLPLTNLRTLCLDGCKLGDIHWIEELKTLVILSLARSDISNLPGEIGSLTSLRLLDLNNCFKLRVIPPNVLSSLVNLEELYMRDINVQWEVEGPNNEGKNASLAELKKLSHLITLEIDIKDANNLPKDLFSEKLERYKIRIGDCQHGYLIFSKATFSRKLELKLNMSSFQLNFGIKMLLKRTEYLYLDESNSTKSVLYELDREDFQQLKHLHIQNNCNIMHLPGLRTSFQNLKVLRVDDCEKLRFIFSSSIARGLSLLEELKITRCKNVGAIFVKEEEDGIEEVAFPNLTTLHLGNLPKIKHVWSKDPQTILRFQNLQNIDVWKCASLNSLFPALIGTCLKQLKEIRIKDCGVLEEIVEVEGGEAVERRLVFEFPQVTSLVLKNLSRLECFYKGVHISKWPMLKAMEIGRCKKVEVLFASGLVSKETVEERQSQSSIKQPLFWVDEMPFPSLERFEISKMEKLEIIWNIKDSHQRNMYSFPNLLHIDVSLCESLKSLFPTASVAASLEKLESLEIRDCGVLEEIVQREDGTDPTTTILFTSLTLLRLDALPKLKWFFQGVRTLESSSSKELHEQGGTLFGVDELSFPSLKTLQLAGLPKIKHVWSKETVEERQYSQMSIKQPLFWVDKRPVPSLEILKISKMEKLEIIWNIKDSHQRDMYNFPKLLHIDVSLCESLKSLFPTASIAASLQELQSLIITGCGVLEEIVEREDGTDPTTRLSFPNLICLGLYGLPKLKWFFQGVHTLESSSSKELHEQGGTLFVVEELSFPSLKTLQLAGLPKIKHVWSNVARCENLKSLFPAATVATSLTQLKSLKIRDCGVLEEIVQREDGTDPTTRILFTNLTSLSLDGLPKLKWFFQGVHTLESSSSKELHEQGGTLFGVNELSFPSLKTLQLAGLPKIKHVWSKEIFRFPDLFNLHVARCENLKSLTQLKSLKIRDCGVLEEIVQREDGTDPTTRILFTSLTSLSLDGLPKLKWFFQGVHTLESSSSKELHEQGGTLFGVNEVAFPKLTNLDLYGLPKIKHVWSKETVEERQYSQMSIKQPLFWVDKRPVSSLEILKISKMEKLEIIWNIKDSHQRDMYNFPKLLHIDVSLCESLKSLFPTASVAASLQELQSLIITGCGVLEEIVEREDGTDPTTRLSFPNLICLGLYGLPKLKWFFQGVHTLELSSSKELHEQGGTLFVVEEVGFPSLKLLDLYGLPKIKHVWSKDSQTIPSFQNLQVIIVGKCVSLKSLFPASIVRYLEQLEKIKIYDCGVEEIVAAEEGEAAEMTLVFPQVTSLCLENLERLEGVHDSKWSMLKEKRNLECKKVKVRRYKLFSSIKIFTFR